MSAKVETVAQARTHTLALALEEFGREQGRSRVLRYLS